MPHRAREYLLSQVWALRPEILDIGLAIIEREQPAVMPRAVEAKDGRPVDGAKGMTRRGPVAVVPVVGPIFRYADFFTEMCGGVTVEHLAKDIHTAIDDPNVSAVILCIDSPGGEASGIGELAELIRTGTDRKPIVAYVGNEAASAAYWIACGCSEIVVAQQARLGSIGVVAGYPTKSTSGRSVEFVSAQSPDKRPDVSTEKGRAVVQTMVDDMADVFVSAVAEYREVTPAKVVSDFGSGGVLIASKALEAGMCDRIGTFEGLLAELSMSAVPVNGSPSRQSAPPVKPQPRAEATAAAPVSPPAPRTTATAPTPAPTRTSTSPVTSTSPGRSANPSSSPVSKDKNTMSWSPKALRAWFGAGMPEDKSPEAFEDGSSPEASSATATPSVTAPVTAPAVQAAASFADSPEAKALREQVAALSAKAKADAEKLEALASRQRDAADELIRTQATAFVEAELFAGRIVPTEKEPLAALYAQLASDDYSHPLASGKRVDALRTMTTARPSHGRFSEHVSADALPEYIRLIGQRADGTDPNAPPTPERTKELLSKFAEGRRLLAAGK